MSAEPLIKATRKRSSSSVKFEHIRNDYFNAYQFYALCYEIQVQINFWWRLMVSRSYKITSIFDSRLSVDPPSSKPVQISFLTIMWPSHDLITWSNHMTSLKSRDGVQHRDKADLNQFKRSNHSHFNLHPDNN